MSGSQPREVEDIRDGLRELLRAGLAARVGRRLDRDEQNVFLQLGARVVRRGCGESLVDGYQVCQGCWLVFETDDRDASLCEGCVPRFEASR